MKSIKRLLAEFLRVSLPATASAEPDQQTWDPVCQDPPHLDSLYPAENREVAIVSSGARMNGVLFMAQGSGPHRTAILLHGFPGNERNLDLAQAIRRSGWNVLTFHYRGAWGSEGSFSFAHVLEDVTAAIDFVLGPAGSAARCSPEGLVLIGHSMGGWAALLSAARDQRVWAVGSLAGWNVGWASRNLTDPESFAKEAAETEFSVPPLRGTSADALTRERAAHIEKWDIMNHVSRIADKSILLIAASRDDEAPPAEHHFALLDALAAVRANDVTGCMIDSDHVFSDRRIALIQEVLSWLKAL